MISKEYIAAIVLILGSILKSFHVEIPNELVEAVITGILAVIIAVSRYKKGDITVLGSKKV